MHRSTRQDGSTILGAHLSEEGCAFALWAPRADRVELALVDSDGSQHNVEMAANGGTWQAFVRGVHAEQRYGFRVHGSWDPDNGLRANPAKLLVDPYAKAITAGVDYSGPILDHAPESNYIPDTTDSSGSVPLSVVVADSPPPEPIAERTPLHKSVICEVHLKGFTRLHPAVPEHLRGTYSGFGYPAVIDHLKATGVTAVQFLPIQHFVSEPFIVRRGMNNYWGYNTLGFFAPHASYCSVGTTGEQVREFRNMVTELHRAGIEVILDVVYNHTCEGGHEGPTLSFRGIDHRGYYRLTSDLRNDYDVTGCGNSVDTSHEDVVALVLDSMRYWVTEMGVDGFRFDLATTMIRDKNHHVDQAHDFKQAVAEDPTFEGIKMIAEPWDMGPYGYQVGRWGSGWSEWNDRFRDHMRDYWRGSVPGVQELATRMSGSSDIFGPPDRPLASTINFITAHDGFTLRDLTTYELKHNEANGEGNRDGSDNNRSWNCGYEGETNDPAINALRHRQVRNMMMTLLLADGVPMLTAGDEMGRSQRGNNNAYCQDNPLSWVNWDTLQAWTDVHELTERVNALRNSSPLLSPQSHRYREEVVDGDGQGLGRYQLAWLNEYSGEMGTGDWKDVGRRMLGMYVSDVQEAWILWLYSGAEPLKVKMPPPSWGNSFRIILSSAEEGELPTAALAPGEQFVMPGRTVVLMQVEVESTATTASGDDAASSVVAPVAVSVQPIAPGADQDTNHRVERLS